MTQLAAGNEEATVVLFERYRLYVFNTALAILKDRGEAQDIVQQTFFELYRTAERFDSLKGSFPAWLFRIASHAALNRKDYLQARQFYKAREIEDAEEVLLGRAKDSLHLAPQEQVHLIHELLARLKPAQRRAIELKFFEGLTADQAALRTGESPSTFENNLYRGLKKLRSLILKPRPKTG
ncbi:MAG TPA: sigma-70 family RNA polymerase sigma factor [Candidatus Angelobacter sp.]